VGEKSDKEAAQNPSRVPEALDGSVGFVAAFSQTSAVELAVFDNQLRFRAVNNATAAIPGIPAENFIGKPIRDIIGDAAVDLEARLQGILTGNETPSGEVSMMLPTRTELGYWIHKDFSIKARSGRITQMGSLGVEVTSNRKLEESFRKLGGELLWRNQEYKRLARELHSSISEYHIALGMSLDRLSRCTADPERIPELFAQSPVLGERIHNLTSVVERCFAFKQQH
jgi:transcriptional regulator with PAS, ATPase and Fis domain